MTFCFRLRPKWRRLVADDWCDLNRQKKARDTNFHRLIRLKALSRLLTAKLTRLVGRLAVTDFKGQDALRDAAMREAKIHIPATEVEYPTSEQQKWACNHRSACARPDRRVSLSRSFQNVGSDRDNQTIPIFPRNNSSLPEGYR